RTIRKQAEHLVTERHRQLTKVVISHHLQSLRHGPIGSNCDELLAFWNESLDQVKQIAERSFVHRCVRASPALMAARSDPTILRFVPERSSAVKVGGRSQRIVSTKSCHAPK